MAITGKGWRAIMVNGRRYLWQAIGDDGLIRVIIATRTTVTKDGRPQQLRFSLGYHHSPTTRLEGGVCLHSGARLHQRTSVSPGVVALAIRRALASNPPFTGDLGKEDVTLAPEVVCELQERAISPTSQSAASRTPRSTRPPRKDDGSS